MSLQVSSKGVGRRCCSNGDRSTVPDASSGWGEI